MIDIKKRSDFISVKFWSSEQLKIIISESWKVAGSESGANNTLAGEALLTCYFTSLNEYQTRKIQHHIIRFGEGRLLPKH